MMLKCKFMVRFLDCSRSSLLAKAKVGLIVRNTWRLWDGAAILMMAKTSDSVLKRLVRSYVKLRVKLPYGSRSQRRDRFRRRENASL